MVGVDSVIISRSSEEEVQKHCRVHAFWWSTCGQTAFLTAPDKVNVYLLANSAFMLAYGSCYGYHTLTSGGGAESFTVKSK